MPHIRVEFDALEKFDRVDHACGLPLGTTHRGLMLIWREVVRSKRPTITKRSLRGYFPPADELGDWLCTFGFLEQVAPEEYRVKGSDRLLAELRAKSEGGKAASKNLRKGSSKPEVSRGSAGGQPEDTPGSLPAPAGDKPGTSSGSLPATPIHPNTQTALKEETTLSTDSASPPPVDPGGRPPPQLELVSPEPKRRAEDQAEAVFAHWRDTSGRSGGTKFQGKRKQRVLDRLKDGYSVEQLCRAVDGCRKTPHNMGQNDRGEVYDDLELICRDVEHVDRFIRNATDPPKPKAKSGRAQASDWENFTQEVDEYGDLVVR